VAGIIVYALMRRRGSESEPEPHRVAGNRVVEIMESKQCRTPAMVPCFVPGRSYRVSWLNARRVTSPLHLAGQPAGGIRSRRWLSAVSFAP
jgi:hypothetical protein